jgi:hypothetical protein
MGWTTDRLEFESRRVKNFHSSISSRPALGLTEPPPMGTGGPFRGVNRQGIEAIHSPPTIAEVKKCGSIHSLPLYVFMAQCLIS